MGDRVSDFWAGSRRHFLKTSGIALGAFMLPPWALELEAAEAAAVDRGKLADVALQEAKKLGAAYADIRVNRYRTEAVFTREQRVLQVARNQSFGCGVRVLVKGTWGFASSHKVTPDDVRRITQQAVEIARANSVHQKKPVALVPVEKAVANWKSAFSVDPFERPLDEKIAFLLKLNETAMKVRGVNFVNSSLSFVNEQKYFASSDGSRIEQYIIRSFPNFTVTAVDMTRGDFQTRSALGGPQQMGYEYLQMKRMASVEERVKQIIVEQLGVDEGEVTPTASFVDDLGADSLDAAELVMAFEEAFGIEIPDEDAEKIRTVKDAIEYIEKHAQAEYNWLAEAEQAGNEAVEKLKAKPVEPGKYDLVLHPSHLWLTIHESVGHSTELDRALGWEANFAGTSFLTPDKTGKFQFGSKPVNFFADRTQPHGLATVAYDDDGVPGQKWMLVKEGMFVDWQTTRDLAAVVGRKTSYGCCHGDSWGSVPFPRMPNVSLEPSKEHVSLNALLADVKNGILIYGDGSFSIDQQRYNFQFGGQVFWEIKDGKKGRMLRDVAYQSRTPDFWAACDGLGGAGTYRLGGSFNDGKGEPGQSNAVSHGCPVARFRRINVLNTAARRS